MESLSRGAAHATFVENDPRVLHLLGTNLDRLKLVRQATVIPGDAFHPELWQDRVFPVHLVFADPPYREGFAARFLDALAGAKRLPPDTLIIVEHERELELARPGFTVVDRRAYGDTAITFLTSPEKENAA